MQDIEDERARPPRRERAEHLQLATLYRAEFASCCYSPRQAEHSSAQQRPSGTVGSDRSCPHGRVNKSMLMQSAAVIWLREQP
jgi:hypothetical protein